MFSPLFLISLSFLSLLLVLLAAPVLARSQKHLITVSFSLTAIASLSAVAAGVWAVAGGALEKVVIPLGLPDLPFHLRLDLLSGYFLVVVGLLAFFVSIYSIGYVKAFLGLRPVTSLVVFYTLFLSGMFLVVLADDALFFLIAWEMMAAASYFLVLFEDERVENRRAAFLYLVVAHVGAIAILLSFGVMAGLATGFSGFQAYTFDAMRETELPAGLATLAFLLAFFGFSAKAGVIPLHIWLPEAHPVAPSNVSALMSGVMLKTAIYGIVRVTFDLIGDFPWWWGALVLVVFTAATIVFVHHFWDMSGEAFSGNMTQALKNLSIIGALFMIAGYGRGQRIAEPAQAIAQQDERIVARSDPQREESGVENGPNGQADKHDPLRSPKVREGARQP